MGIFRFNAFCYQSILRPLKHVLRAYRFGTYLMDYKPCIFLLFQVLSALQTPCLKLLHSRDYWMLRSRIGAISYLGTRLKRYGCTNTHDPREKRNSGSDSSERERCKLCNTCTVMRA